MTAVRRALSLSQDQAEPREILSRILPNIELGIFRTLLQPIALDPLHLHKVLISKLHDSKLSP
jgi:hypothetical protein